MTAVRIYKFIIVSAMISGCDGYYGLYLINRFDENIEVSMTLERAATYRETYQIILVPCRETHFITIGSGWYLNWKIEQVVVRKAGEIIYDFNMSTATALAKKQMWHPGHFPWGIGPDGLKLITDPTSEKCPI